MCSVKTTRPTDTSLRLPTGAEVEPEGRGLVGEQQPLAASSGKQRLWSLRDALATHEATEAAQLDACQPQVSTVPRWASPTRLPVVTPKIPSGLSEAGFERLADGVSSLPSTEVGCLYLVGFNVSAATAAIAGGLAKSLAQRGRTVLLVDGDLELGVLSRDAGKCERRGLIEILNRSTLWRQTLYPTSHEGLTFLPLGRGAFSRAGIDTARWGSLLQDFRSRFTHVVVSGGGWCAASVALGQACDRTIPVIQLGVTLRSQVEQRVRALCRAGVTTTGCVVID
ncbi:MAG: hypothetical protein VX346_19030 [Planctomycetota bacterium]|nr:hypothetical protein [Planctomycetota bacterium]